MVVDASTKERRSFSDSAGLISTFQFYLGLMKRQDRLFDVCKFGC